QLEKYDGIILDIMMPKLSGIEVLRKLREKGDKTPVLLLTAKGEIEDKIEGLDLGADDYITKPFDMGELLARVRAMLRRKDEFTPNLQKVGNITLNMQTYELSVEGKSICLSNLEYKLLEVLVLNQGRYISTEDLLVKVWGYNTDAEIGVVWVYITYLRKKFNAVNANVEIKAKRNVGYTLEVIP
ncbi:MAG: response regulator transcription factor, partial [Anaerotignaceae bacterium]